MTPPWIFFATAAFFAAGAVATLRAVATCECPFYLGRRRGVCRGCVADFRLATLCIGGALLAVIGGCHAG